jgi:hypothetical protein
MAEFRTLHFPNTRKGQQDKVETLTAWSNAGWRIVSETIEQGSIKSGEACCLFTLCMPLAFFAGRKPGTVTVTLQHDGNIAGAVSPPDPPQ